MVGVRFTSFATAMLIVIITGSKRTVKETYRPFGPKMCEELRVDSNDTLKYNVDRLSCHRIPAHYFDEQKGDSNSSGKIKTMLSRCSASLITQQRDGYTETPKVEAQANTTLLKKDLTSGNLQTEELDSFQYNQNTTLHKACQEGKLDVVKYILAKGLEDINCRDKKGGTPIMAAAEKGQRTVFNFLFSHGCDWSVVDKYNNNLLHVACKGGNTDIVRKLLEHGNFDIEVPGWIGWTPVMFAAYYGNKEVVELLICKGCNVTAVNNYGDNLLHTACYGGSMRIVKYIIIKSLVPIDSRSGSGRTPVLAAASRGHVMLVDLLVCIGCNVTVPDNQNNNLLHTACIHDRVNVVKYIIKQNMYDIESRGIAGQTAVMLTAWLGDIEVFDLLVIKGSNLTVTDYDTNNILHVACSGGHVNMIRHIIKRNILSIDSKGFQGKSPVMFAVEKDHKEAVDLLVSKGCNLLMVNYHNNTILHVACVAGHVEMVKHIIITVAIDVNVRGFRERTPVMLAAEIGHVGIVDLLMQTGCDMKTVDDAENNILHLACIGGHVDMVKYIIKLGIVSGKELNKFGMTAVQLAKQGGRRDIVGLLNDRKY